MIDEKEIELLRHTEYNSDKTVMEMLDTLEALWKVARAARTWVHAFPGSPSVDAEIVLVEALNAVKNKQEETT